MIFTVAIPVYNDQNTIRDCLDSVVNQTVGEDKLEIICVNDGSTDKSGNILDEYMSKYKFIKVIHQQNSGAPGRPRNKAIEAATGDYIYFLDGDDYLGPEALEKMEEKIVQYQSDIIIGRYEGINRGVPVAVFKKNPDCFSFPGSNALFTMSAQKLFKRELLIKHNIRFPEHFSLGEDQPFMIQAYAYSNSIALVKDYPCYYLTNHQTIGRVQLTKKPLSGESFMFRIEETLASIELLNLETDKKRLIFFHYWERIMEVELSALISKSFLIEDKIFIFNKLKKMLDKYQYLDYYQQFSSRHKLLLRLIEKGQLEDLISFWYAEKQPGNMVVQHGKVYPKPELAYNLALHESISFHRNNKFEGEITKIEKLENAVLLEGFCYHSHVDSSNERLFIEVSLREQKDKTISFPAYRSLFEKKYPFEIDTQIITKEKITYFHAYIPIESLLHLNSEDGILDLRLISKIEDYTKSLRLKSKESVYLKNASYIAKGCKEPIVINSYLTKWGNLSLVVKHQMLHFKNFVLTCSGPRIKGHFDCETDLSFGEQNSFQVNFGRFLMFKPDVVLKDSTRKKMSYDFSFEVTKQELKQIKLKKNAEVIIGHLQQSVPVIYKGKSIKAKVKNILRPLFKGRNI
ncbi:MULTISPECIES: glycosyltransferase family 2 protein [Bacillus]|uniref:glycosyltransferase family 2 protein n=1 Tax=Bacillus TaxID=1386 RepID=UPI0006CD20C0|nr:MULTISPECIES: glycosyltransferase family 2 protein [Bacillus]AMQ71555.1 hypothetical protein BAMY6639_12535 [Bacillus amyloliquefaciens UMAF6639]AQP96040.1 glycosyl transferase family 2 [Bacillus sp. 275]KPD35415.1 glycosyl transferase family 2 [Bacillus amyloliquefaciens]MCW8784311.1 glycosyltransferase [Bacillus velezensis]MCX4184936.1 glycosyltransferase family 2 protein [Bacillus amyloliquefaciens]